MRKRTALNSTGLLVALGLFVLGSMVSRAIAAPELTVDKSHKDLGTVKEGIKAHVKFTLTNSGDSKAIISKIESSAACTAADIPTRKLDPGQSMKVDFIFETLGYGDRTPTRSIRIGYNNDDKSPLELSVTGNIVAAKPYEAPAGELSYNFYLLIDIRSEKEYKKEHIIGAVNVPGKELEKWIKKVPKHVLIYLYSDTGEESDKVARKLQKKEYSQCKSLIGGLREWKNRHGDQLTISGTH